MDCPGWLFGRDELPACIGYLPGHQSAKIPISVRAPLTRRIQGRRYGYLRLWIH